LVFHPWIYCTLAPSVSLPYPLHLPPVNQWLSECFLMPCSYTGAVYFDILCHSFFLFFLSLVPQTVPILQTQ
jgi:hypothetical protein